MICARHEGVVVGVRERVSWPLVRVAFLEPVCPVVDCVGLALCEVLRADEELCLLSEQQALGRGCCWRGLSLLVRFWFRVGWCCCGWYEPSVLGGGTRECVLFWLVLPLLILRSDGWYPPRRRWLGAERYRGRCRR